MQTSRMEDIQFDESSLANYGEICQYLIALTDWQITIILSLLRYAQWESRWANLQGDFSRIIDKIALLEHCLMSGCKVEDLVKTNRMLVAAVTGQSVDLDSDLPTGVVDFSAVGLSPKFEGQNGNITEAIEAIEAKLTELKESIDNGGDLEDDIANIWGVLTPIATILGATVGAPVPPL